MTPSDPTTEQPTDPDPVSDAPRADEDADADLERLRRENESLHDQLLRRAAEFQNYRRRSESDRSEAERQGRIAVLMPLLDVYEDLQRSLDAAHAAAPAEGEDPAVLALLTGVELVHRKAADALARLGVEPISATGQAFDENLHEAILQQPAPGGEPSGTVLAEVQPGYRMGDRVIRHARVIVAQ
jgi:molecular chaperone GrpE